MFAITLFTFQLALLGYFLYFAFFNYLYAIASLFYRPPALKRTKGNKKIAVVIVSFNEKEVIAHTLAACQRLTYPNTVILVGDDSNDGQTYPQLQAWMQQTGGTMRVLRNPEEPENAIELWESPDKRSIVLHRRKNTGFKAGNLRQVQRYLERQGIEYMYLLDADWRPQPDALEQSLTLLETHKNIAFVQTRRVHYNRHSGVFQHTASISEETEYDVELTGREVLGHPILFTGCCALFRLSALRDVGGFTSGHLTEDIDLTNRLYMRGWAARYLPTVANEGEIVTSYPALVKQQERWAQGTARTFKEFTRLAVNSVHLNVFQRASLVRQNMYYTTAVAIELAILLAILTVAIFTLFPESYQANLYLMYITRVSTAYNVLLLAALLSNFIPMVFAIFKRKNYHDLLYLPLNVWLSWSLLHTYFWANIKGMLGIRSTWFKTPKTSGKKMLVSTRHSPRRIAFNIATLLVFVAIYGMEWYYFGWVDPYAFFWIPAMTVGIFVL